MKKTQSDGINLYEGYLALVKKEKHPNGGQNRFLLLLPLIVLTAALLTVAGVKVAQNLRRSAELAKIEDRISAISDDYTAAEELSAQSGSLSAQADELEMNRFLFTMYPDLDQKLFEKVRACAGTIFVISEYGYSEQDQALILQANAASVNEVPKFVERLRDTELFQSVQYTGYTSDSSQRYFCTVACTLQVDQTDK